MTSNEFQEVINNESVPVFRIARTLCGGWKRRDIKLGDEFYYTTDGYRHMHRTFISVDDTRIAVSLPLSHLKFVEYRPYRRTH